MQQVSLNAYETTLLNLVAMEGSKANLATIQQTITDLNSNRSLVISEQNESEQNNYLIGMLENDVFNCIIKSGKLIQCYNDYDNVIANETDIIVKSTLINEKQQLKTEIKNSMNSCSMFVHLKNMIKFLE